MKIIEAMKKIKDLLRKADDLKSKVYTYCVDLDSETPVYPDQRRQIAEWLQSHSDVIKEVSHLRYSIQKTNVETNVTIMLGDKAVTKSICEWIHRRKDLAKHEEDIYKKLSEKNVLPEYKTQVTPKSPEVIVRRRLYFDATDRDTKIELYRSEPSAIDSALETINAVTDLK